MNQVNWQDVTPSFEQYEEILSKATSLPIKPFIDLQPRLEATIDRFTRVRGLTRILLVNCTDNAIYRGFVSEVLKNKSSAPVVTVESLDAKELFDRYSVNQDGQTTFESGLLSKADGGYLVVPANLVLANAARWYQTLKQQFKVEALPRLTLHQIELRHRLLHHKITM